MQIQFDGATVSAIFRSAKIDGGGGQPVERKGEDNFAMTRLAMTGDSVCCPVVSTASPSHSVASRVRTQLCSTPSLARMESWISTSNFQVCLQNCLPPETDVGAIPDRPPFTDLTAKLTANQTDACGFGGMRRPNVPLQVIQNAPSRTLADAERLNFEPVGRGSSPSAHTTKVFAKAYSTAPFFLAGNTRA
jgi:hypothetical protein